MTKKSTYDENSEKAQIGDAFSKQTLEEIKKFFPNAYHADGITPEYDIVIPAEEYGFPKIECKVCGTLKDTEFKRFVKIPESALLNTESRFIRLKYLNYANEHSEYYFRTSSMRKYFEKMKISKRAKVIKEGNRNVILWPTHLLDGMYTKFNTTEMLVEEIKKPRTNDEKQ